MCDLCGKLPAMAGETVCVECMADILAENPELGTCARCGDRLLGAALCETTEGVIHADCLKPGEEIA